MNLRTYFHDKVVLITGSTRGIGREAARQALQAGARVVINGRDPATLELTRRALPGENRLLAVPGDLGNPAAADALVRTVLDAWGRLDVVILNAGLSMRGAFSDLSNETVTALLGANFLAPLWVIRAALPALRVSGGRVMFVSSLAAVRGFPGVSVYSASKMALSALQDSLRAEEGARGIHFGLSFLAFTENDPEKTVLTAGGRLFHHKRPWSMTQKQAAGILLQAVSRRRKRTVASVQGHLLVWAQRWFPGLMDRLVETSGGKLHKVEESQL